MTQAGAVAFVSQASVTEELYSAIDRAMLAKAPDHVGRQHSHYLSEER